MAAEALPPPAAVSPQADLDASFRLRVAWGLAAVWLALGLFMLVRRPEALLEHAALGAAGLLAATALDWRDARRLDVILAAASRSASPRRPGRCAATPSPPSTHPSS